MSAKFDASLHDRVVLRSPLGKPSPMAAYFLGDTPNYDNYVEPDESLAAWGRMLQAQRDAEVGCVE